MVSYKTGMVIITVWNETVLHSRLYYINCDLEENKDRML